MLACDFVLEMRWLLGRRLIDGAFDVLKLVEVHLALLLLPTLGEELARGRYGSEHLD